MSTAKRVSRCSHLGKTDGVIGTPSACSRQQQGASPNAWPRRRSVPRSMKSPAWSSLIDVSLPMVSSSLNTTIGGRGSSRRSMKASSVYRCSNGSALALLILPMCSQGQVPFPYHLSNGKHRLTKRPRIHRKYRALDKCFGRRRYRLVADGVRGVVPRPSGRSWQNSTPREERLAERDGDGSLIGGN